MKINFLFQRIILLIIGLSINLMIFLILNFIIQNGFATMFNFVTIYPLLGVPIFLIAVIALCSIVAGLLSKD